jgi:hypothetical protein
MASPSPFGNPYKYSDYLLAKHELQVQPGPFNDIIGDGIFDDNDEDPNEFRFKDFIPNLEEDKRRI